MIEYGCLTKKENNMTSINPYITFNGNCEEAFDFYRSAFGGEFETVSRFSEMPDNPKWVISETDKNKIMHVSLPISDGNTLMGSDTSEAFGESIVIGTNFSISINSKDEAETTRLFNELSQGGTIKMPLDKTFWNSYFGMFTDKFGINWMVSCELNDE